jgi:3-hydroxyacyl-CoA dehydrogenase/enoyl-CoA hydratase/3-hydroxybutyryl-CoA epimerase
MPESAVYALEKMAHGFRRLGRSAGGGFYDYSSDPPQLWSGLKTFERRGRKLESVDVRDRLILAGAIAAIGASAGTTPGSVPAVFGGRIPGDAAQARAMVAATGGEAAFVARANDLTARFGPRFQPPASLPGAS